MLCNVCEGSGCQLVMRPSWEWWDCVACGGVGVRMQHGPAYVNDRFRWRKKP